MNESEPHALLRFGKGYATGAGLARSTQQEFQLVADRNCTEPRRAASFTWTTDNDTDVRVAIGAPLQLVAVTNFYHSYPGTPSGPGVTLETRQCSAFAEFTPEAGHTYAIVHRATPNAGCSLGIVDDSTGAAPADLTVAVPATCIPPNLRLPEQR
ncbi:MAG TPA: hypothetical protein DHW63_05410 [Hyphomonadaceae bacterium]|nr:hypothetical protein [Hyphomonadaceae bacterium]